MNRTRFRDASELSRDIAKSATVKGLDPLEVRALKETDWNGVAEEYHRTHCPRTRHVFMLMLATVSLGLIVAFTSVWIELAAILVMTLAVTPITKRQAHEDGYFDGFDAGHERGVNKVLGVTDDEAQAIEELAHGMDIDQQMLDAQDRNHASSLPKNS
jgi:hypothetical protein